MNLPSIDHFVQVLVALLAITDPPGAVPVYLSLTAAMSAEQRRQAPWRAAMAVAMILLISAALGNLLLKFFGVSLPAFQAAGGLLIVLMGLEMLRGAPTKVQDESRRDESLEDHILVPLAMPLIAGPGAIATVITFTARTQSWVDKAEIGLAILVLAVVVYLSLRGAGWLARHISARGQRIFIRFMGLILVAIGAQLLLSGVHGFRP